MLLSMFTGLNEHTSLLSYTIVYSRNNSIIKKLLRVYQKECLTLD